MSRLTVAKVSPTNQHNTPIPDIFELTIHKKRFDHNNIIIYNHLTNEYFELPEHELPRYLSVRNETFIPLFQNIDGSFIRINNKTQESFIRLMPITPYKTISYLSPETYGSSIMLFHRLIDENFNIRRINDDFISCPITEDNLNSYSKSLDRMFLMEFNFRVPSMPIWVYLSKSPRKDDFYIHGIALEYNRTLYKYPFGNVQSELGCFGGICLGGDERRKYAKNIEQIHMVLSTRHNNDYRNHVNASLHTHITNVSSFTNDDEIKKCINYYFEQFLSSENSKLNLYMWFYILSRMNLKNNLNLSNTLIPIIADNQMKHFDNSNYVKMINCALKDDLVYPDPYFYTDEPETIFDIDTPDLFNTLYIKDNKIVDKMNISINNKSITNLVETTVATSVAL